MKIIFTFIIIVLVLLPFFLMLQMSFMKPEQIFQYPPSIFFKPTFNNYIDLFNESSFIKQFYNSLITSSVSTILSMLIGVPAAYSISRARYKYEKYISVWILFSRMAPPIAFAIPFFLLYRNLGLIDTKIGLIIIYLTFNLSLVIWIMIAFFEGIPKTLEEAAFLDGASIHQTFMKIVLPLTTPGLATTAIFCFLFSWNDFFYSLILTRSKSMTAPVAIVNFMNYEEGSCKL